MKLIGKELDGVKRKLARLKTEKDRENIDSHNKAVAASLHSILLRQDHRISEVRAFKPR
jgi:hypothetical protein